MNRVQRLALTAIAGLMVAACGADGDDKASAAASNPGAPSARATLRDACTLLSESEVAAFTGEPVTARRGDGGRTFTECGWFGRNTDTPYLELTVYWRDGVEEWNSRRLGYGIARSMVGASDGTELDSIVRPGPVPALGDSAMFADLMPAVVLENDVLLEMMVFHLPNARANFRPLAQQLLQRVKS